MPYIKTVNFYKIYICLHTTSEDKINIFQDESNVTKMSKYIIFPPRELFEIYRELVFLKRVKILTAPWTSINSLHFYKEINSIQNVFVIYMF